MNLGWIKVSRNKLSVGEPAKGSCCLRMSYMPGSPPCGPPLLALGQGSLHFPSVLLSFGTSVRGLPVHHTLPIIKCLTIRWWMGPCWAVLYPAFGHVVLIWSAGAVWSLGHQLWYNVEERLWLSVVASGAIQGGMWSATATAGSMCPRLQVTRGYLSPRLWRSQWRDSA